MPDRGIWIIFEGRVVKAGRIEVLRLAEVLSNFQRFVFDYGRARGVQRREYLKVYFSEVEKGSIKVKLVPRPSLLDHPIPVQAVEFIDRLKDNIDDIEGAKEIIKSEFKDKTDLIIRGLTKVEAFWSREDVTVTLGVGDGKPERIVKLDPENREGINTLLKEFMKQYARTITGAIVEWKFYSNNRHFEIITPYGERVRCYYNYMERPELEDVIYENTKKPVEVVGFIKERGKRKKVEDVLEIKPWKKVLTEQFAGYRLKKPIPLEVEYDNFNDVWCLYNNELELYGCGENIEGAERDLEVVFSCLIEEYAKEVDEVLSDKALELKKKLLEYVEV
ncbi:hypothetical protein [Thermococcus sp.]